MAADSSILIRVELVDARLPDPSLFELTVPAATTVQEALSLAQFTRHDSARDAWPERVGIYGRAVTHDTVLRDGDRIEIYRALIADPKQARRRRAAKQR